MKRSPSNRILIYALLIAGAFVFSFPFIWMVSTSVKVDRELYPEELTVFPQTPLPRAVSPYIDDRFNADLPGSNERIAEMLPKLIELIRATGFEYPTDVSREIAEREVARGIYKRLSKRLPPDAWAGTAEKFIDAARPIVDRQMIEQSFNEIYRFVGIGRISVRSTISNDLVLLNPEVPPVEIWKSIKPQSVTLRDETVNGKQYARVSYDFTQSDRFALEAHVQLPFDAKDLRRLQVALKPDDTWHTFRLIIEANGRKFTGVRDPSLSNFDWYTAAWQPPSADDDSTKVRSWIVLKDIGKSDRSDVSGNSIHLTFEVEQSSQTRAWAHKLGNNYIRTLDQIPFWRYVRVSIFLVIANIVLNVVFSSLVAYAFARLTWPGRDICFLIMLATMMIPGQVTMIPHFVIWKTFGSYNTLDPLWLGAAFGSAFHIFLLRQFMKSIPRDLEDSARLDGCGFLRVYWNVILPLIGPSLAAIAIFTFMGTWNNFMGPLLYVADQRLYPIAFGLYAFNVQVGSNPALNMAGSVLMTLPVIVIFFFAQRYFIQGVTLTGLKG
ncbi:MAG TPA: ABC transporter permease subunit [Tepidisphaeraceae bacterium]|nr:ABC transporter permease subunit [Tepidisphaeraceae bacterium]